MAIAPFVEILFAIDLSPLPRGGAEFDNLITDTVVGIEQVNVNRQDFISRYVIELGLLPESERAYTRKFHILRRGTAQAFRFQPPDSNKLEQELVGQLNVTTGKVERLDESIGTDSLVDTYYFLEYFDDGGDPYTRRIVKPSPFESGYIFIYAVSDPNNLLEQIPIGGYTTFQASQVVPSSTFGQITVDYTDGTLTLQTSDDAYLIKISCGYHIPARFENDWNETRHDIAGNWGSIGIRELLPSALGLV